MAAPYSSDLRCKIVQACERHAQSQRAVAELFGVSRTFVEGLLRRYRRSGELVPVRRRPGRQPKIGEASREQLRHWLQQQPDLTLAELAHRLQTGCGVTVSPPTLCRVLQQLGLRRKKRRSTPLSVTHRQYVRHAANTGKDLPATPRRD